MKIIAKETQTPFFKFIFETHLIAIDIQILDTLPRLFVQNQMVHGVTVTTGKVIWGGTHSARIHQTPNVFIPAEERLKCRFIMIYWDVNL